MNLIRSFALLIAVAFSIQAAGSSEQGTTSSRSGTALLHCDPGAHILTIDGARSRISPNDGREDCAIPLPAGAHSVEVAFKWGRRPANEKEWAWESPGTRTIRFEATAGRIYRLKFDFERTPWSWVEDVTKSEANLPSHRVPTEKQISALPESRQTATLVLRYSSPQKALMVKLRGSTDGIWFRESYESARWYRGPLIRSASAKDFIVTSSDSGENFILVASMRKFGAANPCNDYPVPLFENTPGGRVLYLGTIQLEPVDGAIRASLTQSDIEEAREWLRINQPDLADALEPAPYRMARVPQPCLSGLATQNQLRQVTRLKYKLSDE